MTTATSLDPSQGSSGELSDDETLGGDDDAAVVQLLNLLWKNSPDTSTAPPFCGRSETLKRPWKGNSLLHRFSEIKKGEIERFLRRTSSLAKLHQSRIPVKTRRCKPRPLCAIRGPPSARAGGLTG